jgi:hypothetical protein
MRLNVLLGGSTLRCLYGIRGDTRFLLVAVASAGRWNGRRECRAVQTPGRSGIGLNLVGDSSDVRERSHIENYQPEGWLALEQRRYETILR